MNMNTTRSVILLAVLALFSFELFGSYPTNVNVTATRVPISQSSPYSTIVLSVFDEQRNQTINWTSHAGSFSDPTQQDGVVSWAETTSTNIIFNYSVYDPKCGCWQRTTSLLSPGNAGSITSGGVIGWDTFTFIPPSTTNIQHSFSIYDPELGTWVKGTSSNNPRNTGGFLMSSTMVAWAEILYPTGYPTNPPQITFFFRIYDPIRKQWRGITKGLYGASGASYHIQDGTGVFTADGITRKVGYNITTGAWSDGIDTVPHAHLVPSQDTGHIPLKSYMWDMSLGSNTWSWSFGDGGSSSTRSPFYIYTSAEEDPFTAIQEVAGPGGSASTAHVFTPTTPNVITGSVKNISSFGISGVTIELSGSVNRSKVTDSEGNYVFNNLPNNGDYVLTAAKARTIFSPESIPILAHNGSLVTAFTSKLNNRPADIDGDGLSDISIFRPSNSNWWIQKSSDSQVVVHTLGSLGDRPVPRDFDGDGMVDIAVWRPSTGGWYVLRSSDSVLQTIGFGQTGDVPVPSDYDGDEKADIAVYRPSNGYWYILRTSDGTVSYLPLGVETDIPVQGDYDGDGMTDIAVFRPSTGVWYIFRSSDQNVGFETFGEITDLVAHGDYDGDGKTDIATYRPSDSKWRIKRSSDSQITTQQWGIKTDLLAPGDFDGDGKIDIATFRPSTGEWRILESSSQNTIIHYFGVDGDHPILNSYIGME